MSCELTPVFPDLKPLRTKMEYRLLFINENDGAPAFFANSKTRTGHQVQFGFQYAFRR